jgi:NAD(P)-dependent dehydrogenase (short-subunit alcohol dehydrogenase family)
MKRGQHIGKIVITNNGQRDLRLNVKPAVRQLALRDNVVYIIVGGLKGLCGSVAVHLAQHGARHLVVLSRSGLEDEASSRIIQDCAAYQCAVQEAKGDVGDIDFVQRVFQSLRPRKVAGIIQGAMVLRVGYDRTEHT